MGKKKPTFVELVHERGLSLRKLAGKTGIHYSYLCHMGRGRRMPTLERAMKIAKALKTTPDHLFRLISI
jgi:transcriptional regulator with XRE-family HTH domain